MNNSKISPNSNLQLNNHRKFHLKLDSFVIQEGSNRAFVKKAVNVDAIPLLSVILDREKKAKEFFKGYAEVITGTLGDDCIRYPFLNFPSIEKLVADALLNSKVPLTEEILNAYIQFLHRLPTMECYPDRFITEFGIDSKQINKPILCFTMGPIDCIPSNILVDQHSWYTIDHEWFFDFPIPFDLLVYRGIVSLVNRLQEQLQTATCKENPCVLFDGYGKNRTYIPLAWLQLLQSNTTTPLQYLADWSWHFQNQILQYKKKGVNLRLEENPRYYKKIKPPVIEIIFSECYRFLKKNALILKSL